ncbi:MAG: efflux RND transporter permease subunit [Campylobacterales bacterium]|nr:efflux RND transporter permease subunit [Campylobacterales bacterium]
MIEYIIKFGLQKPILNYLLLLFTFILSVISYYKIPKEIFPPANLDAVSITGSYVGASSDILDKLAVESIEDELANLSEAKSIKTVVKTGWFSINVELKKGYKTADVLDDIKDIVTKTRANLPSDMDEPIVKEVVHTIPLITVAIYADKSTQELLEVADVIKQKLLTLGDLSEITIWGDSDKELLITLDDKKIEALGLDKSAVVSMINQTSSIFPAGIIKDKGTHYYLSSQNGEKNLLKLQNMILKFGETRIYLKDIATVEYKLADVATLSHFNGKKNISIGINKGLTGDSIELVKQIKQILQNEKQNYSDIGFDTYTDTSIWIKNRLNTVVSNIIFGVILLSIALFFFINARIAFVVAIGIPTSFMIGLITAEQLGYSINMLSLLGALLALGMLVDEAIVVGENIYRHIEMGKDKFSAAFDGTVEVYPAVLTATATTIFAFLPILLMTGETGIFIKILPIMISVLLLSSLLEAFFFLPLHAKHTFKSNKEGKKSDAFWVANKNLYKKILDFVLHYKYSSVIVLIVSIGFGTIYLGKQMKFSFFPNFDTTQVYINGSLGPGHSIEETEHEILKLEKKILSQFALGSQIDSISSIIGMKLDGKQSPQNEEFYFQLFVNLKERAPENFFDIYINPILSPKYDGTNMTRTQSAQQIANDIRNSLKPLIEQKLFDELSVNVPGTGIVKFDIEMAISGKEQEVASALKILKEDLGKIKGVQNIADDVLLGNLDLKFTVNSYGQQLGFTESYLVSVLKPFYFKGSFSKMYDESGVVDIVLQSRYKDQQQSLSTFEITIPNDTRKVLLSDVVSFSTKNSLSQIFKEDGVRIQSVTASIDGITSAEVYEKLDATIKALEQKVRIDIKGEQEENKKVQKEMMQSFIIALILIFIALVWMFDSIIKSLIILSTIPLSILGVLIGHYVMGLNLSMPGLVGIVGLAGVIVNDGIIMMDFIQNAKNLEDMKQKALLRLRPILLTSLTTILGLSTLIFFASGQALILQPMAVALGFGILWATILNLYYIPMLYRIIYLKKDSQDLQ